MTFAAAGPSALWYLTRGTGTAGWPDRVELRASVLAASVIAPIALVAWLPGGPLAKGWARRAGTPSSLLLAQRPTATASAPGGSGSSGNSVAPATFQAPITGTAHQSATSGGLVEVDLTLAVRGSQLSALEIRIFGTPAHGGGVGMTSSVVTLGTSTDPTLYRGSVTALQGSSIAAHVSSADRRSLSLNARLQIDSSGGTVTGALEVRPGNGR